MLNIESKRNAAELTVTLCGRLDTNTAPELEKTLNASLDGVETLSTKHKVTVVEMLDKVGGNLCAALRT